LSAGLEANLALGEAQAAAGQLREAMTSFQSAGEVAWRQRNVLAFAKAAIGFDHAQFYTHEPPDPSMRLLTKALSVVEKSDSHERCQLLVRLARALHMAGEPERAEQFNADAIEMARRLRDDRSLHDVLIVAHLTPTPVSPPQMQERRNRVNELLALAQRVEDVDRYLRSLSVSIYFAAEAGDLQRIAKELDEFASLSEQRQMRHHLWVAQHGRAMQALLAGDFDAAEKFAEAAYQTGSKTHGDVASAVYGVQMFTIRREQGRLAEVAPVIKRFIGKDLQRKAWRPGFALIASDLGFAEQAQRILDELRETNFDLAFDGKRSTTLSYLAEVCASQADRISALRVYELLGPYRHMTITAGIMTVCYGSAGRFLGELAHVLADWDKAEEHFEHALQMNEAMQAWPWLAHTQHRFARMLRSRGRQNDIKRVEHLLSQSWTTANRLGMIALKERLRKEQH
jgi:tetratricopeptide (TPR) repeat protein